jgi:hypothetical protein
MDFNRSGLGFFTWHGSQIPEERHLRTFMEGLRLVMSPIFALRWLLVKGVPAILLGLSGSAAKIAEFSSMLANIEIASYLLVGGIIAAVAALAVAGYELYRYRDAAKRLASRWAESAR